MPLIRACAFEQRFAAELKNVKTIRSKQTEKGVFVVFEGDANIPAPNFDKRRDTDRFAVCFDAMDKSEFRELLRLSI